MATNGEGHSLRALSFYISRSRITKAIETNHYNLKNKTIHLLHGYGKAINTSQKKKKKNLKKKILLIFPIIYDVKSNNF